MIDFGLSDSSNNEKRKSLIFLLRIYSSNENDHEVNQDNQESEALLYEAGNDNNDESDSNSSSEELFDDMSPQSLDKSTTKECNSSKASQR